MVTPHLPPEQAANALLPPILAGELAADGVACVFVSHRAAWGSAPHPGSVARGDLSAPRRSLAGRAVRGLARYATDPRRLRDSRFESHSGPVTSASVGWGVPDDAITYVPRRGRGPFDRTRAGAAVAAARMALGARRAIAGTDLVHLHSNGLLVEVAGRLAARAGVPRVITLYGTDVWHYDARRHRRFGAIVRGAAHRVFYSRALLEFARPLGLADEPASTIYAPVAPGFRPAAAEERDGLRRRLDAGAGPILVTVKRLHPVAGHEDLLRALPDVVGAFPGVSLWLVGDGPLRPSLEALARDLGVATRVRFLGALPNETLPQYLAAADCFALPSRLESWGTVMLEALACGTPVVATDTAGGQEVRSYFSDDVALCEKEDPGSLAAAILASLRAPRRTGDRTAEVLRARFSPAACAAQYRMVYEEALRQRSP